MGYPVSMTSKLPQIRPELPLDYYHQNFCQLLSVVQNRYADLLSAEESRFIQHFQRASKGAQCLYVRLSGRSKSLFRLSKLHYSEIPDLQAAADELAHLALLRIDPDLELEHLLPLYTKPEILRLLAPSDGAKLGRAALDAQLLHQNDPQLNATLRAADSHLEVLQEQHLAVLKLCFFSNAYQDLSEFVLRDLAILSYESYALDVGSRQFADREQLDQHLQYHACSSLSEEALAGGAEAVLALSAALPVPAPHDSALLRRVSRLRNQLARDLERQGELETALALYELSSSTPARERRARILMSQTDIEQSLALCHEIVAAPIDEAEAIFAQQFGQRHAKRHGHEWPVQNTPTPPSQVLELPQSDAVEHATAQHLGQSGDCYFVENTLFSSVLGLAIWPAVFAPLPGAFSHPFQHRPHDFYDADFASKRADLIDTALRAQLQDEQAFIQTLLQRYRDKQGRANPLVYWEHIDEQLLQTALQKIPAQHWQAIFRRLLSDLRNHRSGLPDLIHFPDEGAYALVEVKGPGDRLQANQKRWMAFFHDNNIPHWVATVRWLENTDNA